ncbi:MAG: YaaR family protein [Oscillospiraceae bacterium]|nr:YaaR family protein [Oscillospiraceae bacterium]
MNVRETSRTGKPPPAEKESKTSAEKPSGDFLGLIKGVEEKSIVERLRALADGIIEQGKKLSDKIDIKELRLYKKMIAGFLDEAVGNSRKFSKQSYLDRRGRHKVYAVIKKVNEELDELTKEVLNGEKDRIMILKRLDDIKGLILDIIM